MEDNTTTSSRGYGFAWWAIITAISAAGLVVIIATRGVPA